MKKYLLLTALFLTTTAQADFWSNCTTYGGTIITANKYGDDKGGLCNDPNDPNLTNNCNGKKFCVGENKMNWWSAFTWCDAIGGKLASFDSTCPNTQTLEGVACPNMKNTLGQKRGWTNLAASQEKNFAVQDSVFIPKRNSTTLYYALCEEK